MKFTELKRHLLAYQRNEKRERKARIINGYGVNVDRGLHHFSTVTRWDQYQAGTITREKAIEYALKRMEKELDKETAEKLTRLEAVENAPEISCIRVSVEWKRSRVWGYNPDVEVWTDAGNGCGYTHGSASGCGYDKESAAVAEAFDNSDAILKVFFTLKEKALRKGIKDASATACTHVNNEECVGYGAGYSVLPYFEGGVGVSCFWSILKKAGFECRSEHGKRFDVYRLEKVKK